MNMPNMNISDSAPHFLDSPNNFAAAFLIAISSCISAISLFFTIPHYTQPVNSRIDAFADCASDCALLRHSLGEAPISREKQRLKLEME